MSIVVNKWRMDPSLNALIHCETGEIRRLGEYHYLLLETLAKNADTVLSRSSLMTAVWKNRVVGSNSLPTAIHALRVAIDDDGKQQEIIKTIPKKGYLFNKAYLTTIDFPDEPPLSEESAQSDKENLALVNEIIPVDDPDEKEALTPVITPTENESLTSSAQYSARRSTRPRWHIAALAFGFIAIAISAIAFIYHDNNAPSDTHLSSIPKIIKEKHPLTERIEIYHVQSGVENNTNPARMSSHIEPGIRKVNEVLATHNATLRLFYKTSFNKFAITLILKNQCENSWQLILDFENWQSKDTEMNNMLFQEVEKMLNDMPKCS